MFQDLFFFFSSDCLNSEKCLHIYMKHYPEETKVFSSKTLTIG